MVVCAVCATESREGSRFCAACGAALEAPSGAPVRSASAGERKSVTAVFCDLVGFTSLSEAADPEDVDTMLRAYFALARREIERHGGTVEKFIGDAVVGMFGVPISHEDDAERAVRAALAIAREATALRLAGGAPPRLRIGINTGETLVHVGAAPEAGEAMVVGDAINTASRIQSVAPEMGVAVGLSTWELTNLAIDYGELPPATLKGKAEPVRVFHARAVRARLGVDLSRSHAGGYIGREAEIDRLRSAFADAVANGQARFVAIVGEPGIGKSRILAELAARVHADHPAVVWRQGRCLPYGDGVTFWALGEIVKAHAGIQDGDDPATAVARIDDALLPGGDHDWLRDRLLPLVGAGVASGEREEQFAAWRAFLAGIASNGPAVVVFEDIHWADPSLLAFVTSVAEAPPDAPLLVLMTARPALDERNPGFSSGLPGLERVDLAPLTDDETRRLIVALLGSVVPAELHGPIVERAEGNPLYAEEFVRLLVDRDLLVRRDGTYELRDNAAIPMPGSINALLAARLDALPAERKTLLADAAVIGKVFWAGAVATMEGHPKAEIMADLAELARVELVRPVARSSMAGEVEYAFWHVLARDVAYQQLPRASRAARHEAAGDWLEAKAGDRVDDVAQLLAHHYATALDLAKASGEEDRATTLEPCALRYLRLAGERAIGLDTAAAVGFLERALALAPLGHDARPEVLASLADAVDQAGRHADAAAMFVEAIEALEARGETLRAARLMLRLRYIYSVLQDERMHQLVPRAVEIIAAAGPSEALVAALTEKAVDLIAENKPSDGLAAIKEAVAVADEIGIQTPARTLRFQGHARQRLGDLDGNEDIGRAIEVARAAGQTREAAISSMWYAFNLTVLKGHAQARSILIESLDDIRARGLSGAVPTISIGLASMGVEDGSFDDTVRLAHENLPAARAAGEKGTVAECLCCLLSVHAIRGEVDEVAPLLREFEAVDPSPVNDGQWSFYQTARAAAHAALGELDDVARVLGVVTSLPEGTADSYLLYASEYTRVAAGVGLIGEFDWRLDEVAPNLTAEYLTRDAARGWIALAGGEFGAAAHAFEAAAEGLARLEFVPWSAFTRLGLARSLAGLGRSAEAEAAVRTARQTFERLRATPSVRECDALLRTLAV